MNKSILAISVLWFCSLSMLAHADQPASTKPVFQYDSDEIKIPAATVDEPKVAGFHQETAQAAIRYLDDGAVAWTRTRKCVACHTTGVYLSERPLFAKIFGPPREEVRTEFVRAIPDKRPEPKTDGAVTYYRQADRAVWRTLGLAEWDKHLSGKLSVETERSLRDMLSQQSSHGGYHVVGEVEIPYVTTDFELSAQAMRAVAAAPNWLEGLDDPELIERVDRLKRFLREETLRNDYERVLRLQIASYAPGIYAPSVIDDSIRLLWSKQLPDGGWSTRRMSDTLGWHVAVSDKVRNLIESLPDASAPESDPYMTAFAIVLLRESGISADDERIQRGIDWLIREQRVSGRWWMHSLYRGNYHFTTYIATVQAMKALMLCGKMEDAIR